MFFAGVGCRALLDDEELVLAGEGGGSGSGSSPQGSGGSSGDGGASGTTSSSSITGTSSSTGDAASSGATVTGATTTSTSTSTSTGGGGGDPCGDRTVTSPEECDDGGVEPNDGCSPTCEYEGKSCEAPIELDLATGETRRFSTTTAEGGPYGGGCGVIDGPGRFLRITPASSGWLSAWLRRDGTTFDSAVLAMNEDCTYLNGCSDTINPGATFGGEILVVPVAAGTPMTLLVAGVSAAEGGTFDLEMTLDAGTCADPVEIHLEPSNGGAGSAFLNDLSASGGTEEGLCGGSGEEVVFRVTPVGVTTGRFEMEPNSGADAVIYARSSCATPGTEVDCADAGGASVDETIEVTFGNPVYVLADCDAAGGAGVRFDD